MAEKIENIIVMEPYETCEAQCKKDDIYVKQDYEGRWFVGIWDGREAWCLDEDLFDSRDEALDYAVDCYNEVRR